MKSLICASMLILAGSLAAARPAAACSTVSPRPGLALEVDYAQKITRDGVIMVRGEAFTVDVDTALAALLLWEVRRDDVVLPGSFEVVPLWDRAASSANSEHHVFALIWRAEVPLAPDGVYTLDFEIQTEYGSAPEQVELIPISPLDPMLPDITVTPQPELVEPTEVVCCETPLDSCGTSKYCEALAGTLLPAIDVSFTDEGNAASQQVLWVAPVLPGGEPGPRVQASIPYRAAPWSWFGTVVFDTPAEQYCVVVGATSARDGSEVVSEPRCFGQSELGVPHMAQLEPSARTSPYDPDAIGEGECIGPIVYEADGAAYPRGTEQPEAAGRGCDMTAGGGSWLVLLAVIRRRRARA